VLREYLSRSIVITSVIDRLGRRARIVDFNPATGKNDFMRITAGAVGKVSRYDLGTVQSPQLNTWIRKALMCK